MRDFALGAWFVLVGLSFGLALFDPAGAVMVGRFGILVYGALLLASVAALLLGGLRARERRRLAERREEVRG